MKGLKIIETFNITFEKQAGNEKIIKSAYFNSETQTIINKTRGKLTLKLSKQQILLHISQWISEVSGPTIKSIDKHYLNIVKYQPMKGNSYIKLPKELQHSAKGLINLQNNGNKCFLWCYIRHLNLQNNDPQLIKKSDKEYINNLGYTGIEFPATIKQINKIEAQNKINIHVFVSKEKYGDCISLLLITEINQNTLCTYERLQ